MDGSMDGQAGGAVAEAPLAGNEAGGAAESAAGGLLDAAAGTALAAGNAAENAAEAGGAGQDGGAAKAAEVAPGDMPITDWSAVNLNLPEGVEADPALMESLGKVAVDCGLTENQARALAAWNIEAMDAARKALHDAGVSALRQAWGTGAERNQQAVRGVVSRIDRAMEAAGHKPGAFSAALNDSGADLRAEIIAGLYEVSRWVSEDSLGRVDGAAGMDRPETALEGLQAALNEARGGQGGRL